MSENYTTNQADFEILEQYVLGTLQPEKILEFEKRLKNDQHLQQQLKEYKILISGVEQQSLLNKLNDFHEEINLEETITKKAAKKFSITRFSIAASLALIVSFGGLWMYRTNNSNQKLYSKYFKPDPGLPTVMGIDDDFEFNEAMVNYKMGEYQLAIEKWEEILHKEPQNDTLNYFLGVAYLSEKNQFKTIEHLSKVLEKSNGIFRNDANYYLGLAYLKNNELKKSIQHFEKCENKKRHEILEKLNKLK